jgi:hypothetical protein
LLVTINRAKESMYWDAKGNVFKILKNSLQESLGFAFINILTIRFWSLKIPYLRMYRPQPNFQREFIEKIIFLEYYFRSRN